MATSTWVTCSLLLLGVQQTPGGSEGGPLEGLMPAPVRQAEKRSLLDERNKGYYDYRMAMAAFSPDGKYLLAGTNYQGPVLWDVKAHRVVSQFTNLTQNEALALAFTRDGKQFFTSSWGGYREGFPVSVWNLAKRERLRSLDEDVNDTPFTALAVSPDGKTLALGAGWGRRNQPLNVVFWDIASGDEVGQIAGLVQMDPNMRGNNTGPYQALAYAPDGRTLAVLVQGRVILVELATSKVRGEIAFTTTQEGRSVQRQGMPATFGSLAFAPDGRALAVGCPDGAVRRFDLRTGRELTPLPGHGGPVSALCWTPDGKRILSYGLDSQLFAWRADLGLGWQPKAGPLGNAALDALWDVLRDDDALDLFACQQLLAAAPKQTVPYLGKKLAPVAKGDSEKIEHLIQDMLKGDYNKRKRAVLELRKIGPGAITPLRKLQERGIYDDMARRLLMELENQSASAEQVRGLRALRVLERIGDAESRKLLEELAGGAPEAVQTVQAKAALDRLSRVEPAKEEPKTEALWEALAGEDSAAAYRAVRLLAGRSESAALLQDRLKEVVSKDTFNDDPKRVAKLIADLDSKTFTVREQANKALRNLGRLIVPSLRKALEVKQGLEAQRRLEKLLEEATKGSPPPDLLRVGRVLETLELMSAPEGRQALTALVKDVPVSWLRDAAADSLRRLGEGKQ